MDDEKRIEEYQNNVISGSNFLKERIQELIVILGREGALDCLLTMTFSLAIAGVKPEEVEKMIDQTAENAVNIAPLLKSAWVGTNSNEEYKEWFFGKGDPNEQDSD
jgi:hypothetical protein